MRGVVDKHLSVVDAVLRLVEDVRRTENRLAEERRVHRHPVLLAELPVPFALKFRSRINQCEIDIEKDGFGGLRHRSYGPATTTAARAGSSVRCAAAFASSNVTASRSAGNRRSWSRPRPKNSAV